ncbi:MAG: hypothetical protein U0798_10725 [Gemmataceae bacterium]
MYVACEWMGNTQNVARTHYLKVTDEHFKVAQEKAAQKAAQQPSEIFRIGSVMSSTETAKTP